MACVCLLSIPLRMAHVLPHLFLLLLLPLLHPALAQDRVPGCPEQCTCVFRRSYYSPGPYDQVEIQCNRYAASFSANMSTVPMFDDLASNGLELLISIEQMDFERLPARAFRGQRIGSLRLLHNSKLRYIEPEIFQTSRSSQLFSLVILNHDNLDFIPLGSIAELDNLQEISLELKKALKPELIEEFTLGNLQNLRSLTLHGPEFIPALYELSQLGSLTQLSLSGMQLTEKIVRDYDNPFRALTRLSSLNLGSNAFTRIPRFLKPMTTLRVLSLENNRFGLLGTDLHFDNLPPNLVSLNLRNNEVNWLPCSIFHMSSLEYLTLDSEILCLTCEEQEKLILLLYSSCQEPQTWYFTPTEQHSGPQQQIPPNNVLPNEEPQYPDEYIPAETKATDNMEWDYYEEEPLDPVQPVQTTSTNLDLDYYSVPDYEDSPKNNNHNNNNYNNNNNYYNNNYNNDNFNYNYNNYKIEEITAEYGEKIENQAEKRREISHYTHTKLTSSQESENAKNTDSYPLTAGTMGEVPQKSTTEDIQIQEWRPMAGLPVDVTSTTASTTSRTRTASTTVRTASRTASTTGSTTVRSRTKTAGGKAVEMLEVGREEEEESLRRTTRRQVESTTKHTDPTTRTPTTTSSYRRRAQVERTTTSIPVVESYTLPDYYYYEYTDNIGKPNTNSDFEVEGSGEMDT